MYEYKGPFSYDTYVWASNLPEEFNAATSETSITRQIFNYAVGIPLRNILTDLDRKSVGVAGIVLRPSELPVNYVSDAYFPVPEGEAEGNYLINSTFDIREGKEPYGWFSDTAYYTSDYLFVDNSISQTVYFEYTESLYFGIEYSSETGFSITLEGPSSTTTINVPASNEFRWYKTDLDQNADKMTITINGDCGIKKAYLSNKYKEWTHSAYDNPWFLDKCGKALFYTDEDERLYYIHKNDYEYACPLGVQITSDTQVYEYETYSLSDGDSFGFDFETEFGSTDELVDYIQKYNPSATFKLAWTIHGTTYISDSTNGLVELPIVYDVISDSALFFTVRGIKHAGPIYTLLDGEEKIVWLDDRFEDYEDWVDYYGLSGSCSCDGQILTINVSEPCYVLQSSLPDQEREPIDKNTVYGYIVSAQKNKMSLEWSFSGEYVSAEIIDIEGEYFVENAVLARFAEYDQDGTMYFSSESSYDIKAMCVDQDGYMYLYGEQDSNSYLWITNLDYVHPSQSYLPVFAKMYLDITFTSDDWTWLGKYRYSQALHLENKDIAFKINLLYPYITFDEKYYTRYECSDITAVMYDYRAD